MTSMLRMSPSHSGRESGMPWQMHSFTEVHTLLGNLPDKGSRRAKSKRGIEEGRVLHSGRRGWHAAAGKQSCSYNGHSRGAVWGKAGGGKCAP